MKVANLWVTRWIRKGVLCFLQLSLELEVKGGELKSPSSCLELEDDEGEKR